MFSFLGFKKKPVVEDIEPKPQKQLAPDNSASPVELVVEALPAIDANVQALPIAPERLPEPNELKPEFALEPETKPDALAQMGTPKATREDVIAAYKIFLGRLPESMEVVDPRVGLSPAALLVDFLGSKEFLDQTPKAQLVLTVAKKIVEAHRQSTAAENTAPNAGVDAKSP